MKMIRKTVAMLTAISAVFTMGCAVGEGPDYNALNDQLAEAEAKFSVVSEIYEYFSHEFDTAFDGFIETNTKMYRILLTDTITGNSLTENDADELKTLGYDLHGYLTDCIETSTASSIAWYDSLFSYGGKDPLENDSYNDLVIAIGNDNEAALEKAGALGAAFDQSIADAVEDGIIDLNEYRSILEQMMQFDEILYDFVPKS